MKTNAYLFFRLPEKKILSLRSDRQSLAVLLLTNVSFRDFTKSSRGKPIEQRSNLQINRRRRFIWVAYAAITTMQKFFSGSLKIIFSKTRSIIYD
ncbi:MAG: hypothetical protein IJM09_06505 [Neisseriaceae bacterium]|nr:hypothetical protein [Neisseriaceae bacterium]